MSIVIMTKNQIPSLKEFVFATDEIKQSVDDLSMYYQLQHQQSVELYEKWKNKTNFSGTIGQMVALEEIKSLIDLAHGKDWIVLQKAIFLIEHYSDQIDMDNFYKLHEKDQLDALKVITKGQKAFIELEKWLKPLNKEDVFEAITKANRVTIGNKKYDKFQVLKFGKINSLPNEDNSVNIYPHILEIDNPTALVEYFKNLSQPVHDSLIITFMRSGKYDFKTSVFLFFIWKGIFYILDFSEKRLNIDNPSGSRNPDRYLDDMFGDVFLPVDVFLDKKKSEAKDLVVKNQNIFKREEINKIFEKSPEIKAWVNMFLYRVIDYIENNQNKIELGVSILDVSKALEDKSSKKIETRVKTTEHYSSFQSQSDASSYLLKKYENKITSMVVVSKSLPMMIGTRKFLENVLAYKKRDVLANDLQKLIADDYKKNHKTVYMWFRKFVKSQNIPELVSRALEDNEYHFKLFKRFGSYDSGDKKIVVQGRWLEVDESIDLQKMKILSIHDLKNDHVPYDDPDDLLTVNIPKNNSFYLDFRERVRHECSICRKVKWSIIVQVNFIDYRQIIEFFKIEQDVLPKEFIEHFHYQNESYVGNSRLQDTDPVDEVKDIWFREFSEYRSIVTFNDYSKTHPHLDVRIPICRRCLKKYKEPEVKD